MCTREISPSGVYQSESICLGFEDRSRNIRCEIWHNGSSLTEEVGRARSNRALTTDRTFDLSGIVDAVRSTGSTVSIVCTKSVNTPSFAKLSGIWRGCVSQPDRHRFEQLSVCIVAVSYDMCPSLYRSAITIDQTLLRLKWSSTTGVTFNDRERYTMLPNKSYDGYSSSFNDPSIHVTDLNTVLTRATSHAMTSCVTRSYFHE